MSRLTDVFTPTKTQIGINADDFIEIDAVLNENHQRSMQISENEVEEGANITDHARRAPDIITLTCTISEIPTSIIGSAFNLGAGVLASAAQSLGAPSLATSAGVTTAGVINARILGEGEGRALNNLLALERYMDTAAQLKVQTSLKEYSDMIIQNIAMPRDPSVGDSLEFTITLKQIRIVSSRTVLLPEAKTSVASAASEADLGQQKTEEASAEQEKKSSIAFRIFSSLGGS